MSVKNTLDILNGNRLGQGILDYKRNPTLVIARCKVREACEVHECSDLFTRPTAHVRELIIRILKEACIFVERFSVGKTSKKREGGNPHRTKNRVNGVLRVPTSHKVHELSTRDQR